MTAHERVELRTEKASIEEDALFDSRATLSFMDGGLARRLGYHAQKPRTIRVEGQEATEVGVVAPVTLTVRACESPPVLLGVIKGLRSKVITGRDIMNHPEMQITLGGDPARATRCTVRESELF